MLIIICFVCIHTTAVCLTGYARIIFMGLSFYFATISWKVALVCYLLAFGGDAVDGYVARACNQSKKILKIM
jgi:CDP-diacylglycerol--inositol 3-phosphatidyltransferase